MILRSVALVEFVHCTPSPAYIEPCFAMNALSNHAHGLSRPSIRTSVIEVFDRRLMTASCWRDRFMADAVQSRTRTRNSRTLTPARMTSIIEGVDRCLVAASCRRDMFTAETLYHHFSHARSYEHPSSLKHGTGAFGDCDTLERETSIAKPRYTLPSYLSYLSYLQWSGTSTHPCICDCCSVWRPVASSRLVDGIALEGLCSRDCLMR